MYINVHVHVFSLFSLLDQVSELAIHRLAKAKSNSYGHMAAFKTTKNVNKQV